MSRRNRIRSNVSGQVLYPERLRGCGPKLHIIVHNIGGPGLNSTEAQLALSILASSPSVCLLASLEHLNTPLLWDLTTTSNFNWVLRHISTFRNYVVPSEFALVTLQQVSPRNSYSGCNSLQDILASLQLNHRQLIGGLCKLIVEKHDKRTMVAKTKLVEMDKSVTTLELYAMLKGRMIVKDQEDLNKLLKEFIDHKVLVRNDKHKTDNLTLQISDSEVMQYVRLFHSGALV